MKENIQKLVNQMTLEEKASLCSGKDWWNTKPVERLVISSVMVSDGPSGMRTMKKTGANENDCVTSVSFPCGCAVAASFDKDLLEEEGKTLGEEAKSLGVDILLGPAINIKRSPLCGRNFEYFSEDPYLAGELATSYTKGVQSKNVGVSVKHFAANNQEYRRFSISEIIEERVLREIYLPAFENVVKNANPATIMCSYNAINGVLSSENKWLLTDVLRKEWGFKGFVMSDWGAVNDRVLGVQAGLNLEMPYSGGETDGYIVKAVKDGSLDEKQLDEVVGDILDFVLSHKKAEEYEYDREKDHAIAAKIACESSVLLKNNNNLLPLNNEDEILFVGYFAESPRFEGGGSSNIKSYKVTSALDEAKSRKLNVVYEQGFNVDGCTTTDELKANAIKKASMSKKVVIFAGLPDSYESEGFDRDNLDMPAVQNELIEEISKVCKNVVVVLHNGAPVVMPWIDKVDSVLESYLGGEAVGIAQIDLLFGKANPCGKLPETFPLRLEDTPSFIGYHGNGRTTTYSEGVFVGYRWYDARKMNVLFPFGHGLSYTSFEYKNISVDKESFFDNEEVKVNVTIKNTGKVFGKEIVQLYVKDLTQTEVRPEKELKGFDKVSLNPGEEKTIIFVLNKRSFAYFNTEINDWYCASGLYELIIGASSEDLRLSTKVEVKSTSKKAFNITRWTTPGDMLKNKEMAELIKPYIKDSYVFSDTNDNSDSTNVAFSKKCLKEMFLNDPFRDWRGKNGKTDKDITKMIEDLNNQINK
ncbi:MAG: glycosyl hydrolase [Treponema sp.]|nr:glycosyl hydrolase [Treponema sp.]